MTRTTGTTETTTAGHDRVQLQVGDDAPRLALPAHDGRAWAFGGRPTIVYFYPGAFTPGCTTEACDFRDSIASLRGAGYAVVGVSPDPVETIARFAAEERLSFTLLSDVDAHAARAWGAWGEKVVGGETVVGVLRSTVVLDRTGRVEHVEYGVDAAGHVSRLREALGVAASGVSGGS